MPAIVNEKISKWLAPANESLVSVIQGSMQLGGRQVLHFHRFDTVEALHDSRDLSAAKHAQHGLQNTSLALNR